MCPIKLYAQIGSALKETSVILTAKLQELRDFDTALLANTIGYIDSTPAHEYYMGSSIRSVTPALGPTVGIAVTCEIDSSTPGGQADMEGYWQQMEEITEMAEPAIWVARAVGSRPDHECVLGDGMAKTFRAAGCEGAVTNAGARDVAGCLTAGFAVYCTGKTIHHGPYRFRSVNQPVELGGITVHPGDVLHANQEGVIRIPPTCLNKLAEAATRMRAFEHETHRLLRRTDLTPAYKRSAVAELVVKYGFGGPKPAKRE